MAAPPVPFRADSNNQQYTPSFPPIVYYRDTFGLEPVGDRTTSTQADRLSVADSEESGATKSTIRQPVRIFHPDSSVPGPTTNMLLIGNGGGNQAPRCKSYGFSAVAAGNGVNALQESQYSQLSTLPSQQMEELLITDQILLIVHSRALLILSAVLFGVALQLLIFSVVCIFFDGSLLGLVISVFELITAIILLLFVRYKHTRMMMCLCIFATILSAALALALFVICTYLLHSEDVRIRTNNSSNVPLLAGGSISSAVNTVDDGESNQIVQNARMVMYTLQLIYAPVCAICTLACLYICALNWHANREGHVRKGFFLSQTAAGHQNVLVPIRIRQVGNVSQEGGGGVAAAEMAGRAATTTNPRRQPPESVAVQTSNVGT